MMSSDAKELTRWQTRYGVYKPGNRQGRGSTHAGATADAGSWSNWAGSQRTSPRRTVVAASEEQVTGAITTAREQNLVLRAVGASHSFSAVAATNGLLLSLDGLRGVTATKPLPNGNTAVSILAGTRLRDIPSLLEPLGLALPNQGDVNPQSLAGALSTGTHGTGLGFTGFAGLVREFRIAVASGEVLRCSPTENADLFHYARVGIGSFGVLTEVTLECVPKFCLHAVEQAEGFDEVVDNFTARCEAADHFEFYWFPYTERVLTKTNTRLPWGTQNPPGRVKAYIDDELLGNGGFELVCRLGTIAPGLVPALNRFSANTVASRDYTDAAHNVFVSPRRVRFNEMEYAIPLADLAPVLREVRRRIHAARLPIEFPLEVRAAAADEVPLSTACGRESAYIAIHRYWRKDFRELFALCEPVLREAAGRPHWGKMYTLTHEELCQVHPDLQDAARVRAETDPDGVFLSAHARTIFGVA